MTSSKSSIAKWCRERNSRGSMRMYKGMGITSFFERGRLWLDAATYQLRRSRFEFAGVHPALPAPIQLVGYESTYVESRFGILVPERIVIEWYENLKSKAKPVFALSGPHDVYLRCVQTVRGDDGRDGGDAGWTLSR